jgi:glucose-1-phosphate adenylyltransferase
MKNVTGIINLNESEELLQQITRHRPLAGIPFGGRYRLIDFTLSNMVNSGIYNVGILAQTKYRSLLAHLRSGKEWDLARKQDGLFILPPAETPKPGILKGDIENFHSHLDYIQKSKQKYVIISGSSLICNINYREAFRYHQEMQADITVLYKELADTEKFSQDIVLDIGDDGRVFGMKPYSNTMTKANVFMGMYIMEKKLLGQLIAECIMCGGRDLIRDGLAKNIGGLKIYGYRYDGYVARIHSLQSYYRHSMALLNPDIWRELFFKPGVIYTKVKDGPPVKYKESAEVQNSLVANGCVIEGTVENSILFRAVKVAKGAHIKNCIIMQQSEIGENALLENIICDIDVRIARGKRLIGENSYPVVLTKGAVVE